MMPRAYAELVPIAQQLLAGDNVFPPVLGSPPSPAIQNEGWFGDAAGPITLQNQSQWETISAVGAVAPATFSGVAAMPAPKMKGTFLFSIGTSGFSESLYDVTGTKTYADMKAAMIAALAYRAKLSFCEDQPGCVQPLKCIAIRVEDETVPRDAQVYPMGQPLAGIDPVPISPAVYAQNMQTDSAVKCKFTGPLPRQQAIIYFHAVPTNYFAYGTVGNVFNRVPNVSARWLQLMGAYCDFIRSPAIQLGFRYLTSPWDNADGTPGVAAIPVSVTYDTLREMYNFTMPGLYVPPGGSNRARYVLRGFKNLNFLNGRRPGLNTAAGILRIVKKVREDTWDGTGFVSPEVWTTFMPLPYNPGTSGNPSGVQCQLLTERKVGRPFGQEVGRRRAMAS